MGGQVARDIEGPVRTGGCEEGSGQWEGQRCAEPDLCRPSSGNMPSSRHSVI